VGEVRVERPIAMVVGCLVGFLLLVALLGNDPDVPPPTPAPSDSPHGTPAATTPAVTTPVTRLVEPLLGPILPPLELRPTRLPDGRSKVFGGPRFLVAYYGTANTGSLGVLGETGIEQAHRRLMRAARPFRRTGERIQPVYELIVTVADAQAGSDGDYSHDIAREEVARYIRAAHRNNALVLLDLQPGRSDFRTVAKRWEWALSDPLVGLALDPEWRMGRRQVPARVIGSVGAAEINRTSSWLGALVQRLNLPQKLFVIHQFRTSMIPDLDRVRYRPKLAMVQHVDGFGTPRQKLATFRAVVRPKKFLLGLKLFYDEDVRRLDAGAVRAIRPRVRFVSFQ
jgi:hypothetical protein